MAILMDRPMMGQDAAMRPMNDAPRPCGRLMSEIQRLESLQVASQEIGHRLINEVNRLGGCAPEQPTTADGNKESPAQSDLHRLEQVISRMQRSLERLASHVERLVAI